MQNQKEKTSRQTKISRGALAAAALLSLFPMFNNCAKSPNFALLGTTSNFQQSAETVNNKIDILWVVDNSPSMTPLQTLLVQNFQSFMSEFQSKGFDFQITVTTTDAYRALTQFSNNPTISLWRDGVGTNQSGIYTITPSVADPVGKFVINASQGDKGSGDERAFQSMIASLNNPSNAGFIRPGAFHAVIILSDEDDFSSDTRAVGAGTDHNYSDPSLWTVDSVVAQLDALTGSTASGRNYNVSAITVLDSACQQSHSAQKGPAKNSIIGQRYIDLANATNGTLGSVCDSSYESSLNFIQQKIVELATSFKLAQLPQPATITVAVNNVPVVQDPTNGWTYDSVQNSITFHGTAVPQASASIQVNFTPATLQ